MFGSKVEVPEGTIAHTMFIEGKASLQPRALVFHPINGYEKEVFIPLSEITSVELRPATRMRKGQMKVRTAKKSCKRTYMWSMRREINAFHHKVQNQRNIVS